jgi:hypothetical protein
MVTGHLGASARRDVLRVSPSRLRARRVGRRTMLRVVMCVVALAVIVANAWAFQHSPDPAPPAGSALEALETLAIREPAPRVAADYDRDAFGRAWYDVDDNGCDTRNDILARDLEELAYADAWSGCVVRTGTLDDPYTGTTIEFVRGVETSAAVQIDHVVALGDAWSKGAAVWDPETRRGFANDPLNLIATDGSTNAAKGSGDAAEWLPPAAAYRCPYVARQIAVKVSYELAVSRDELDAMRDVLATCPAEPLPRG